LHVNALKLIFKNLAVEISEQNVASTERHTRSALSNASDVVNAIFSGFDFLRPKLLRQMGLSAPQLLNSLNRCVTLRAALKAVAPFFSE
jgi:hypothetical protein